MVKFIFKFDNIFYNYLKNIYKKYNSKLSVNLKNIDIKNNNNLTKNKIIQEQIDKYTITLLKYYIYLFYFFFNYKDIEKLKIESIKNKNLNNIELSEILKILTEIKHIEYLVNNINNENINNEIEKNLKYKESIKYLNSFNNEYIYKYLIGKTNDKKKNIIQTIIIKYYKKNYRKNIFDLINKKENIIYKKIKIIVPQVELFDYFGIETILTEDEIKNNYTKIIYNFINKKTKKLSNNKKINLLFQTKQVIPITNNFLRYHKLGDKQEEQFLDKKIQDTMIKNIIHKIENAINHPEKDLFHKKLNNKSILYNEFEEIHLLNKFKNLGKISQNINEYYQDLIKYREYAYLDFKNSGIELIINNKITCVRENYLKNCENDVIDTSVISNKKLKIVGLFFTNNKLFNIKSKNIMEFNKKVNNIDLINKYILDKKNKINNYLFFNKKRDSLKNDKYIEIFNDIDYVKNVLVSLYDNILNNEFNNIKLLIKKNKISFDKFNHIINNLINNKILIKHHKNFNNLYYDLIKQKTIKYNTFDKKENILYGINNSNKIKKINYNKKKDSVIKIKFKDNEEKKDYTNIICQHNIDWVNLIKLKKYKPNLHIDLLIKFIKKYAITNNDKQYICRSCEQLIKINNYLVNPINDGGIDGIDVVLTTSNNILNLPQYMKYSFTVKNIESLIEKISSIINYTVLVGNLPINKFKRNDINKFIIDLISIQYKSFKTLKINKRERQKNAFNNYGINFEYSNFFLFPLDNDIFKFSSNNIDKFKKIKINNIICYIILLIIIQLNPTQILLFEINKYCNIIIFNKVKNILFEKLYIRFNNDKEIKKILDYPLLCYIIFYITCLISQYKLWFFPVKENVKLNFLIIQKRIIHTFVDLLNYIMEIYSSKNKHFLYEILGTKFSNILINTYNKSDVLNIIKKLQDKNIHIKDNRIILTKSKIKPNKLDGTINITKSYTLYNKYDKTIYKINKELDYNINNIDKEFNKIINEFRINHLKNIAKLYKSDGNLRKSKLTNIDTIKISELEKINNNFIKNKLLNIIKYKKNKLIINNIDIKNNINDNLDKLLNIIEKNVGNNLKINKNTYNIRDQFIILSNDYLGNKIVEPIYINLNNNKINITFNKKLNNKVYEIFNKSKNIILYYNFITLNYIGYKESSSTITNLSHLGLYLKFVPSIKAILLTFGFKKINYKFTNIDDISNIYKFRFNEIKNIIFDLELYLNKLNNKIIDNNILKYYVKKIKKIKLFNNNIKVFNIKKNNIEFQKNNINYKQIELNKFNNIDKLSNYDLNALNLINYLINEIIKILELNKDNFIKSKIIYFLFSIIIKYYFNNYDFYIDNNLIKFNYILESSNFDLFLDNNQYTRDELDDFTEEEKLALKNKGIDNKELEEIYDNDNDQENMFNNKNF